MEGLKAVLFDTFGTVVDWRGSLIADFSAWGEARGLSVDWPAFVDAWRGAYRPSMDRVRDGAQPWTILDDLHRRSLDELTQHFGIAGLGEDDLLHLTHGWRRLKAWPDAIPGLVLLRHRFIVSPLSNGNVALLVNMAKFAGIEWDMVFGADIPRVYKPDPRSYLGACAMLGLQPGEVMMAAAHNYDLAAARALGLRTGFILRPTEHGQDQRTDLAPESDWDVVATSIVEMADRLGC
jgi:2-haloacid dehalogenase